MAGYVVRIRVGEEHLREIAVDDFEMMKGAVLRAVIGPRIYWFSPSEWMSVREEGAAAETAMGIQ